MASENDFWEWFSHNQQAIESYESGNETLLDDILIALHKYNDALYFEFSTQNEVNEFIISAGGDSEQFDSVFTLVGAAPKLKNWAFIALKPAMGFDFISTYEGVDYDPDKIWFLPLVSHSSPDKLGLRVGIPHYNSETHEHSVSAIWIVLDAGLGEFKSSQKIDYIETVELPSNPEELGYIEFNEIGDYLDWLEKKT